MSRVETIIRTFLGETVTLPNPVSRIEILLLNLRNKYEAETEAVNDVLDEINGEVVESVNQTE